MSDLGERLLRARPFFCCELRPASVPIGRLVWVLTGAIKSSKVKMNFRKLRRYVDQRGETWGSVNVADFTGRLCEGE
jgi:hypothetical protein